MADEATSPEALLHRARHAKWYLETLDIYHLQIAGMVSSASSQAEVENARQNIRSSIQILSEYLTGFKWLGSTEPLMSEAQGLINSGWGDFSCAGDGGYTRILVDLSQEYDKVRMTFSGSGKSWLKRKDLWDAL